MKPMRAAAVASMVASMFAASGCGPAGGATNNGNNQQALVKCAGANECAGKGSCAGKIPDGGMHDCAGKNSCAGQGWIEITRADCTSKGGREI